MTELYASPSIFVKPDTEPRAKCSMSHVEGNVVVSWPHSRGSVSVAGRPDDVREWLSAALLAIDEHELATARLHTGARPKADR